MVDGMYCPLQAVYFIIHSLNSVNNELISMIERKTTNQILFFILLTLMISLCKNRLKTGSWV